MAGRRLWFEKPRRAPNQEERVYKGNVTETIVAMSILYRKGENGFV